MLNLKNFNAYLSHQKQTGFLLPAAIFLLVILAGLGAYAVNINTVQLATATQDIQSIRAYHLARAGAELSVYYVMQTSPDTTTVPTSCAASASTSITLDGFSIARSCENIYSNYFEQGSDKEIGMYNIISTATFGTANALNYVQREIKVDLSKCRDTTSGTACP